jgi:UPF0716 protein FxsA
MSNLTLIILLLTVAFPLLEFALLIKVGSIIGVFGTIALIIGTAIFGSLIVRHQGLGVAKRMVTMARTGEHPAEPMLEGALLLFAGGCLIAPGVITDVIGLTLIIPPIRRLAARWLLNVGVPLAQRANASPRHSRPSKHPHNEQRPPAAPTIEGDFERIDEKTVDPNPQPRNKPPQKP